MLCRWSPIGRPPAALIAAGTSLRTWLGTPTPIVSASWISSAPASARRPTCSITTPESTSPSNGQPKATLSVTTAWSPAACVPAMICPAAALASSTVMFWFLRLKVSVSGYDMLITSSP